MQIDNFRRRVSGERAHVARLIRRAPKRSFAVASNCRRINHRDREPDRETPASTRDACAPQLRIRSDRRQSIVCGCKDDQSITDRYTLADLERWGEITRDVDPPIRLGVFGDPVAHSLSPQMQNAALRAFEINMQYARFHIRANELRSALRFLRELDFVGINLTVPHKIAGLTQIDVADESASHCGAVNTLRLHEKKLIGSNTDAEGFSRAVRSEFSIDLRDLRVMILGAGGGTGHAIAWQCALENCERLVLVNRTPAKTSAIVERLRLSSPNHAYLVLSRGSKPCDGTRPRCARNSQTST